MIIENIAVGLVQLVTSIVFAVLALYAGFALYSKIAHTTDAEKELLHGNVAVAIIIAAVFIAIAIVVESGVSGLSLGIDKALKTGIHTGDGILIVGIALVQLVFGIVLSVGAISLSLIVLEKLVSGIKIFEEIRKGNSAVALAMAGVIIAVTVIVQSGVLGITSALG